MSHAAFLSAIRAEPTSDVPRLVYADWLDEQGDSARAEFIRVECQIARLPAWSAEAKRLEFREWELRTRHQREWLAQLPQHEEINWQGFRRGFVDTVRVGGFARLHEHGQALAEAVPNLNIVIDWSRNYTRNPQYTPVGPLPGVTGVQVQRGQLDAAMLPAFLADPLLTSVERLDLSDGLLENELATALCNYPPGPALRELHIGNNNLNATGVAAIANAPWAQQLEVLELAGFPGGSYADDPTLRNDGVRALASGQGLQKLRSLNLAANEISDDGLAALATARFLPTLKELYLQNNDLTPDGLARFFARCPAQLDVLDLSRIALGRAGVAVLRAAPACRNLRVLRLNVAEINAEAIRELVAPPFMATLCELRLGGNPIGAEGAYHLAQAEWPALNTLHVGNCDLDAEAGLHLAASAGLANVLELVIGHNDLGSSAAALASLPRLRCLQVDRVGLNDARWAELLQRAGSHLMQLYAGDNRELSAACVQVLKESAFTPQLRALHLDSTGLRPTGILALTEVPALGNLLELNVAYAPSAQTFTQEVATAILASPHLQNVRAFDGGYVNWGNHLQHLLRDRFQPVVSRRLDYDADYEDDEE